MEKVKIFYDREGNTLNVWFDSPEKEASCEETVEEVILVKDKTGKVIGFEKLNFRSALTKEEKSESVPVEIMMG
jgi:uncharacterized protein YuzE